MTTIRQLLFFLFSLFLIVSCVEDKQENIDSDKTSENDDKIHFQIGFVPTARVSTGADFKCEWEEGDEIGIFAISYGTQLLDRNNPIHNKKLTYRNGNWEGEIYWNNNYYLQDFYAYFPYDDNNGNPEGLDPRDITFNVLSNQNAITTLNGVGKTNYSLSDFMIAKSTDNNRGTTVSLEFSHTLSMIQLKLDNQNNNIVPDNIHAKMFGCADLASIHLMYGVMGIVVSDTTFITMYRLEQPGDTDYNTSFTFRALIPTQTISAGHHLFIINNHGNWFRSQALTSPLVLEAGKAELFGLIP